VVVLIRNLFACVTSSCDSAGAAWCYCNDGLYFSGCLLGGVHCDVIVPLMTRVQIDSRRVDLTCVAVCHPLFLPMISERADDNTYIADALCHSHFIFTVN